VKDLAGNTFNDYSEMNLSNGIHNIEIIFENKGRPNTGYMEEKKGIKSLSLISPEQFRTLKEWKFSVQLSVQPNLNPAKADTGFNDSDWMNFEASQKDFYIPEGWLREKNSIVFVMRPGSTEKTDPELKSFSIHYNNNYVVQKHELKIEQ